MTPSVWPYVNDFLHVRFVPSLVGWADVPAFYLSKTALPESPEQRDRRRRRGVSPKPPALEPYYRLTPGLYARLVVAVDRLAATKDGGPNHPTIRRAHVVLSDLRDFLVIVGAATGAALLEAIDAARGGKLPPLVGPMATADDVRSIDGLQVEPVGGEVKESDWCPLHLGERPSAPSVDAAIKDPDTFSAEPARPDADERTAKLKTIDRKKQPRTLVKQFPGLFES